MKKALLLFATVVMICGSCNKDDTNGNSSSVGNYKPTYLNGQDISGVWAVVQEHAFLRDGSSVDYKHHCSASGTLDIDEIFILDGERLMICEADSYYSYKDGYIYGCSIDSFMNEPEIYTLSIYDNTAVVGGWINYKIYKRGNRLEIEEYYGVVLEKIKGFQSKPEMLELPPSNEIWYTCLGENRTIQAVGNFGANIISNTNQNGLGRIVFDAPIKMIESFEYKRAEQSDALTNLRLPTCVKYISSDYLEDVFGGSENLKSVNIPCNIEDYTYSLCYGSFKNIHIHEGVTSIGEGAFHYCSDLTSITIPKSVISIGREAFADCYRLEEVYCKATTPPIGSINMFSEYDNSYNYKPIGCKIYVPIGSVNAYKSADGWSDYAEYIVGYGF